MILSTFLIAVVEILRNIIYIYSIVIVIACVMSFINPDPYNKIVQLIYRLTDPAFNLVRKIMPTAFGGLDVAPIVVWVVLMLMDKFILRLALEFIM